MRPNNLNFTIVRNTATPYQHIMQTIGNTPMVQLKQFLPLENLELYAKLESFNPGGSIKDRTAFYILQKAIEEGKIKRGGTVIESSSGNMAVGLAQVCLYFDLQLIVVVDPKLNRLTAQLLKTYGATIVKVDKPCRKGGLLGARLKKVKELLEITPNSFWSNQYGNLDNPRTHEHTTREIFAAVGTSIDYLFVATSTCGTLMGCTNYIKSQGHSTKIIAVDALGSVLFEGEAGDRKVPGHGAGVPSQFLEEELIDEVIKVTDLECVQGCWDLLKKENILVGGSSGGILSAVKKYQPQLPKGARCVVLLSDGGERYLDTIYNPSWLLKHIPHVKENVQPIGGWKLASASVFNTAIVGVGPKGLYSFERLLSLIVTEKISEPTHIHLFNKNEFFGAGDIYRTDQPEFLKMNFTNEKINAGPSQPHQNVFGLPSYIEWLSEALELEESALYGKFSSRAMVGRYLRACFLILQRAAPANVHLHIREQEVTHIQKNKEDQGFQIYTEEASEKELLTTFQNVLMTTGHDGVRNKETSSEKGKSNHINFIYPVTEKLSVIPAHSKIAIKGMGLTFIDAVLALTEGRGGVFRGSEMDLEYVASGREPQRLFPYSRSGALMIPRVGEMPEVPELRYFLIENFSSPKKIDFVGELLPLIMKEFTYRYYDIAFQNYGETLQYDSDFDKLQSQIDTFHQRYADAKFFDFEMLCTPFKNQNNYTTAALEHYLDYILSEVSLGKNSPLLAAISAWHAISPMFNELYSFGGLTPESQQLFDANYASLFNRLSYGPPLVNMYKIKALIRSGILDFSFGKSPEVEFLTDALKLKTSNDSSSKQEAEKVTHHIDARIPKINLQQQCSLVYKHLYREGHMQPFQNKDKQASYLPGAIALSKKGEVISSEQKKLPLIIYGTATEGVTFDNDTLSRNRNDFGSIWARETLKLIKNHNLKKTHSQVYEESYV
ncbi:2,3-diaminopropionate biosynthesis protein SbnA [Mesonia aestuariivivens]|uniref:N-(2-amino-2-carboxyethyl)-L-glutamate synthase n=1 Tax=Mesonia aestuariivivens TaxID=2796128 RepID=A0ABS6W517_9FLAO|nr:2,3-diaminopropionate biosynthesis protein SbnA [Mesonia aestuariivivens]MBW2962961.1 2,3-diaminopropionate biosynthesis protein SbnA [Mesonia aestuariivivens]